MDNIIPTKEQKKGLDYLKKGCNLRMEAVAGAGKSTFLILAAIQFPELNFLILTYNKDLEIKLSQRIKKLGLKNISVKTYHGAASSAYGRVINNDMKFIEAIKTPPRQLSKFTVDVIASDEAQDLCVSYYLFIQHLLKHNPNCQMIIVGDKKQSIYQYKGSRHEYLTECHRLFDTGREWKDCPLSISQRLTPANAEFVNTHILNEEIIVGGNTACPNLKPVYISTKPFPAAIAAAAAKSVLSAIKTYGVENVAILAASTRVISKGTQHPLAILVKEHLSGVKIFIAADDEMLTPELMAGKMTIATFNSVKGKQFDCVIILGFDETHFKYIEKGWGYNPTLPNVIYVAATRAYKQLVVVASENVPFRTVDVSKLRSQAEVIGKVEKKYTLSSPPGPPACLTVSSLVRHTSIYTMREAMKFVNIVEKKRVLKPKGKIPKFLVPFNGYSESVNVLYGIVIPAVAELHKTGQSTFGKNAAVPTIVENIKDVRPLSSDITMEAYNNYPDGFWSSIEEAMENDPSVRSWEEWFRIAVAEGALEDGRHHVARQLCHYDWVDEKFIIAASSCVEKVLAEKQGTFEAVLPITLITPKCDLFGRADFVEEDGIIWEFKCSENLTEEHILQLACYLAMAEKNTGQLYAILSGEILTIELLDGPELLKTLIKKYDGQPEMIDIVDDIKEFKLQNGIVDMQEEFETNDIEPETVKEFDDIDPSRQEKKLTLNDLYANTSQVKSMFDLICQMACECPQFDKICKKIL